MRIAGIPGRAGPVQRIVQARGQGSLKRSQGWSTGASRLTRWFCSDSAGKRLFYQKTVR
jgi:hypothetical protein